MLGLDEMVQTRMNSLWVGWWVVIGLLSGCTEAADSENGEGGRLVQVIELSDGTVEQRTLTNVDNPARLIYRDDSGETTIDASSYIAAISYDLFRVVVAHFADGNYSDAEVIAIELSSLEVRTVLSSAGEVSGAVAVSPDDRFVAVTTLTVPGQAGSNSVHVHDLLEGTSRVVSSTDVSYASFLAFSDTETLLIGGSSPSDCLVAEVELNSPDLSARCAIEREVLNVHAGIDQSWTQMRVLASCADGFIVALMSTTYAGEAELVSVSASGAKKLLNVDGQRPSVSPDCQSVTTVATDGSVLRSQL